MAEIEVDDQWKEQAEQAKQELSGKEPQAEKSAGAAKAGGMKLPAASFELMVQQFVTQIAFALGLIPHPSTGKAERDLDLAKHYIDMLAVLSEKTKGNLTSQEDQLLQGALYEVRMQYVAAVGK